MRAHSLLKILGCLLFVALLFWVIMELTFGRGALVRSTPNVTTDVKAFSGSAELPAAALTKALEQGRESMAKCISRGNSFSTTAHIADWIAFGLTAGVTLLAGYLGQPVSNTLDPAAAAAAAQNLSKDNQLRRFSVIVGAMAALASIATAASGKLENSAKSLYERADKIHLELADFKSQVQQAKSPGDAQSILDDFDALLLRSE